IPFVPLFVKYPAGSVVGGEIDDLRAETTDILPTIADVVDTVIPWDTVGVSLLHPDRRGTRTESIMVGTSGPVAVPVETDAVDEGLAEKESWFPEGDPFALTPPGWRPLLGAQVEGDEDRADVRLSLDQTDEILSYRPGTEPIPAFVSGTVVPGGEATGEEIIAISLDGRVVAVTRTFEPSGNGARWEAMIAPSLLDAGVSSVEAWLVTGSTSDPTFYR